MRNSETKRGCGSAEVISTRNKEGCRTDSEEHVPAQCAPPSRALATHGAQPCDSRPALVSRWPACSPAGAGTVAPLFRDLPTEQECPRRDNARHRIGA